MSKTATAIRNEDFRRALRAALAAALALSDTEDGGTCNMDSPVFIYKSHHMKVSTAEELIRAEGLRCWRWMPGYLCICGCTSGQGNCRPRMALAFCKSMQISGYDMMMYYQID